MDEEKQKHIDKLVAEHKEKLKTFWDDLKPFQGPYDVPPLPVVDDPELWAEFYVPRLIAAGAIPKKDLINGGRYIGRHRNTTEAIWRADKNQFEYKRTKFGHTFDDYANHFEDDDNHALFTPIDLIR